MTPRITLKVLLLMIIATLFAMAASTTFGASKEDRYVPDNYWEVAEIFWDHCTRCHYSEGAGDLEAGLVVIPHQELMDGDSLHGPAIIPGNADESMLVQKLGSIPPFGARMPYGTAPLTDEEINTIKEWINDGAKGPKPRRVKRKVVAYPRGNIISNNKSKCETIMPVDGNIINIKAGKRVFFKVGYGFFLYGYGTQGKVKCRMKLYIKEGDEWVFKGKSPRLKKHLWGPALMSSPIHKFSKVFGVKHKFKTPGTYEVKAVVTASTKAKNEPKPQKAVSEVFMTVIVSPK